MTTWQRRLRIALGVFILLFAGAVYLAMRRQPPPAPPPKAAAPVDPRVQSQVSRGIYTSLKGSKVDFKIEYDTILEYTGASTIIRGVKATFPDRNGRTCILQGDKATVAQDQSSFTVTGHVRFSSSDGLVLNSDEASYTKAEDIVRAPGKGEFTKGSMHGSGVGLTYDQGRDIIAFADQFEMTTTGSDGQPPSEAHSGSMVWTRREHTIRLDRAAKIVRGGQTLEADVAMLYLTDDEQHLRQIQLQGNSHVDGSPSNQSPAAQPGTAKARQEPGPRNQEPASSLRSMRARDINLVYGEDGEALRQSVLTGGAQVEVRSAGAAANTRISGEFVEFGFEADGSTMRSLAARGAGPASPARLDIPAQGDTPRRVIRSASMQGPTPGTVSPPGRGMTTLRCSDEVVFNEAPAPPGELRTATSRLLDLVLEPGLGAVQEARFAGRAHLEQGTTLEATARDARYDVKGGTFEFTGPDDQGGPPSVKDQDATIRATRIVVHPDNRKISASGAVQTTIQPAKKRPDGSTVHTPGILSQDEPTLASSDSLEYDGAASRAVFRSKVQSKLWQVKKGNSIFAVEITVDDAKGDLAARGSVVSVVKLEQTDAKTKKKEIVPTTITADQMAYEDATHRATYTGRVVMKGGAQGDLKTDRAELYLNSDGSALDRLEGFGNIDLSDPGTETTGRRKTTGERVTYRAADEYWIVTGKLVKMSAVCQGESEGRQLEFWRSIDKMIIDGKAERRTQTKGGPGCKK